MKFGEGISVQQFCEQTEKDKNKRNKFNAIKTEFNGQTYDSRHEASYAQRLEVLKTADKDSERVVEIERQVAFSFDYNGVHICKTVVDFKITYADGHIEYHDPKGKETREASIKSKLMKAFYGIDVKFIYLSRQK